MAVALLVDDLAAATGPEQASGPTGRDQVSRPTGPEQASGELDDRVVAAAVVCIGRVGLAKTTLGDVAAQVGCSRATVYRLFPGGKDALVAAVARYEIERVAAAVERAGAGALTKEGSVSAMMAEAARQIRCQPALSFLHLHEPEAIVGWLAFQGKERLLAFAGQRFAPVLERFVDPTEARRLGEWGLRALLSWCLCPWPGVDLADDASAAEFVTTFLFPAQ